MARRFSAKDKSYRQKKIKSELPLQNINLDFSNAPTIWKFLHDDAFFRGICGPVGSGKSYASASEILLRALRQPPSPKDNIRYSRAVVVRNSYPELRTTTIKTWLELFNESQWGPMRWSPPLTHHLKLPPKDDIPGLDCEVIFIALDQPKDIRKLLSLELTFAWCNEARELPLAIIQGLTSRIGRYPTKAQGGCPWRGIWADTNGPDDDSWWYRLAEKEPVQGKYKWNFYNQPGGMIESSIPTDYSGGGKFWEDNKKAENINNLPEGYYHQMLGGKDLDWLRVYVGGSYGFVKEGKSVWEEYDDTSMVDETLTLDESLPIQIGIDFGLTPACVFGQRYPDGRWHILHELVTEDMGLERFGQMLLYELNTRFKGCEPLIWGDPAGQKRDEIFEVTSFDHLRGLGLHAQPTASNDFMVRREAGALPMTRLVGGKPGLQIHKSCRRLRKALAGGYHFKRVGISGGTDRFRSVPLKNQHSHIGDSYAYLMLGGGEHKKLVRGHYGNEHKSQVHTAKLDFDIW